MENLQQSISGISSLQELDNQFLNDVDGGTQIGWWIGYGIGSFVNAFERYYDPNTASGM